jgi:pimeloyl-ACP methyl ester carboxylesterase
VLVSPFWFDINPFSDALLTVASLFLPETFNPFKLIPARRIEESSEFSPPPGHLYPTAPEFFRDMKDVHLPLIFLEQFAVLSRSLKGSLGQIKSPVLVLQGAQDRVVRPAQTRKLVRWLSPPPPYKEIPGEHHIVMPDNPAFSRVAAEIIAYINQFA